MPESDELSSKLREIRVAIPARFREPEPAGPEQNQREDPAELEVIGDSEARHRVAAFDPAEDAAWADTLEMATEAQASLQLAEATIERLEARSRELQAQLAEEIRTLEAR